MTVAAPITVAHIIFRFGIGGLENGIVNLINNLGEQKYRHFIICLSDYDAEFAKRLRTTNTKLIGLGKRSGHDLPMLFRLFKLLRALQPDVLHTRNFGALEVQLLGFLLRIPRRIHGEHGWDVGDLNGTRKSYQRARRLFGFFAHRFTTVSAHLQTYLVEIVGIPRAKVEQIYNGVDTDKFFPAADNAAGNHLVIGTVGRMQAVKNQTLLTQAFSSLLKRRPELQSHVRLRLVGDGPLLPACEAILRDNGVLQCADLVGASTQVADELRKIDIFVLPSLAEGISNTILEAMASALPVIATDVGGNAELVSNGVTGTLVPSGDISSMSAALETYVDNAEIRNEHGRSALERIRSSFALTKMLAHYDALYSQSPWPTEQQV